MQITGYTLASNSLTAEPGYYPSLVGSDPVNLNGKDVYFAAVEIEVTHVTSIARSRWMTPDNDFIVGVKMLGGKSFYIPAEDLHTAAIDNERFDVIETLAALRRKRVFA
jgi:hypothetical protein